MTDTANLEDGFYWVKRKHRWVVAERFENKWYLTGYYSEIHTHYLEEIDPRPIKREP